MNKIFATGKPLAEPMEQILLDLGDGPRAHIVLAVAEEAALRREILAELGERLSGRYALYELDYARADPISLPRVCRTLQDELPTCLFAYGLEELRKQEPEKYETALDFLNAHREDIRDTQSAVILCMASTTRSDLLRRAPDFADWRTTDATFSLPDGRRVEETPLGRISIREAERLRHQALRFEGMLQRNNLEPAMKAELHKQLALVRKQLGQDEQSEKELSQSSRISAGLHDYNRLEDLYRRHVIDLFSKLTLYSFTSDAPLAVDLERVFVKLTATQQRRRDGRQIVIARGNVIGPGELQLVERLTDDDPWSRHSPAEEVSVTLSLHEALRTHLSLAVIGAPGAGKTTLLHYIALTFARDQAQERLGLDEDRLPVFIALRNFNRFLDNLTQRGELLDIASRLLPDFLTEHVNAIAPHLNLPADFFRRALTGGRCAVLLDGLDEVADPVKRARIAEAVALFVRHYGRHGNRFVVTSRPRGYEGEAKQRLSPLCAECAIRDFDDDDMAAFVRSWYEAVIRDRLGDTPEATAEAGRQAEDLLRTIRADERVKALGRNPLLLSVLAMVHQRGVGLPQRRAELYDECTDLLLGYWDQTKGGEAARELAAYGELDRKEKRNLLAPVALWFHEHGEQGLEADQEELTEEIARQFQETFGEEERRARRRAELFLRVIEERAGLLTERETGVYAFAHLTFQEYLAARAVADRDDYLEYTKQRLHDPWWREVILLEVGHLSDVRHFGRRARRLTTDLIRAIRNAGSPLEETLQRDLLLAARCLCDAGKLGVEEELRRSLLEQLMALWRRTPYQTQREEAEEIFAYTMPTTEGAPIRAELIALLRERDADVRTAAASALGRMGSAAATPEVLDRLVALLADRNVDVRTAAASALGRMGPAAATSEVLSALLNLLADPESGMRGAAAVALGEMGPAAVTPEVLSALLNLLVDPESGVRWKTATALGRMAPEAVTPEVLAPLLDFLADPEWDVRWKTAVALGRMGPAAATPEVLSALLDLLADPESDVRQAAAEALSNLSAYVCPRDRSEAVKLFLSLARSDDVDHRDTGYVGLRNLLAAGAP